MNKRKNWFLSLLLVVALPVFAANNTQPLSYYLDQFHTMSAQFTQKIYTKSGTLLQQSEGEMALARPGNFRWQTNGPSAQLLIIHNQQAWNYDASLAQVVVQKLTDKMQSRPAELLSKGSQVIAQQFNVIAENTTQNNTAVFRLTPKKADGMFTQASLTFSDKKLTAMVFQDSLDQRTQITFSNIVMNQPLNQSLFVFTAPKGTTVVHQ